MRRGLVNRAMELEEEGLIAKLDEHKYSLPLESFKAPWGRTYRGPTASIVRTAIGTLTDREWIAESYFSGLATKDEVFNDIRDHYCDNGYVEVATTGGRMIAKDKIARKRR